MKHEGVGRLAVVDRNEEKLEMALSLAGRAGTGTLSGCRGSILDAIM
ncbi:hypothetical protein [Gorillibacterium timonense]|nr:hypothetical protein [Gorillibacterium timonense]